MITYFTNLKSYFHQIPCVIFALFLGPWSDQAGRKLLILVPYVGYFLFCVAMLVNTYFFDELYVEFLWLENVSALCGSYKCHIPHWLLWIPC